ncbi:MAG: FkbM family methyltransferase [Acidobacteriota bacterium]|nr:MAG: FkbM family methyltransferase [Acidobacteriota bacterium]
MKEKIKKILLGYGYVVKNYPKIYNSSLLSHLHFEVEFIIAHYLLFNTNPYIVQVGAYDGVTGDPLHAFIEKYNLRAVLIEPQEAFYGKLLIKYEGNQNVRVINAVVANNREPLKLYCLSKDADRLVPWASQVASLNYNTLISHKRMIPDIESYIYERTVEAVTICDIADMMSPNRIDILYIDAEGYDAEIVMGIDFDIVMPDILHYEHKHLRSEDQNRCLEKLISGGYRIYIGPADTTAYKCPSITESYLAE